MVLFGEETGSSDQKAARKGFHAAAGNGIKLHRCVHFGDSSG